MNSDVTDSEDGCGGNGYGRLIPDSQKDKCHNRQTCYGNRNRTERLVHALESFSIPIGNVSGLEFGTEGQSRRLEAIRISVPNQPVAGGISYEVHARGIGWEQAPREPRSTATLLHCNPVKLRQPKGYETKVKVRVN